MSPEVEISTLRQRREAIVMEHGLAESVCDVERTLATFHYPRYDVKPLGEPADGEAAVRAMLTELFTAFPDFTVQVVQLYHADDAVILETILSGTQQGPFAGLAPTGRKMAVELCCIFEFEEDRMINEKVYFDLAKVIRQLQA